jgi:hypothetical protein
MALLVVGSIADLVSFGFADMSLLAPLGAMTLVINMFFAPCFNREKLSKEDIGATMVILLGTIISISFGSKSSKHYTLNELLDLYTKPLFISYISVMTCILVGVFAFLKRTSGLTSLTMLQTRAVALSYPTLAGTFGAHSVLFAKSSAEIVKSTIAGTNEFVQPPSYLLISLLFFFLFLQMRTLNQGLRRADALVIVPVYQVSWVMMNAVVGMMYFQDYKHVESWELALFFLGLMVTLFGVYLLARRELIVKRSRADNWLVPIEETMVVQVELDEGIAQPDTPGTDHDSPKIKKDPHHLDLQQNTGTYEHATGDGYETRPRFGSSPDRASLPEHSYSYRYSILASEETEIGTNTTQIN